jgi:hypothetical protein
VQELVENNLQTASEVRTPKPEEEQITTAVGPPMEKRTV